MECIPCGDPPPPYEPHCKYSHRTWFINLSVDLQGSYFYNMTHLHKLLLHCPKTLNYQGIWYILFVLLSLIGLPRKVLQPKKWQKKKNPCIKFLNFHIYKLIISVLYHCAAEFLKSDFTTASQWPYLLYNLLLLAITEYNVWFIYILWMYVLTRLLVSQPHILRGNQSISKYTITH